MRPAWPGSSATSSASAPNHGCAADGRRQHGVDDAGALAALLRPAQHRIGDAEPAAHHAEGVADADQRRVGVGVHGVEEREQRRLPRRRLDDALAAVAAVVVRGIDVAGPAGAEVEAAAARRAGAARRSRAARRTRRRGRAGRPRPARRPDRRPPSAPPSRWRRGRCSASRGSCRARRRRPSRARRPAGRAGLSART